MTENSDHLDKETSVSVAVTDNSIKAGAKSRFVAAIDRLGGSVVDSANAAIESYAEKRRAKTKGEVRLIEAITDYGVAQLGADPKTAERAFQRHFRKVLSQQENIDHVLLEAKADLELNPPANDDPDQTEELSEEFMDRFEEYSACATTEELRQRWGRILSAEIRKPGTFSSKVLRATDELDATTARVFERVMQYRSHGVLVKAIMPEMEYLDQLRLIEAGLLVDPGIGGQTYTYVDGQVFGVPTWGARFGGIYVCIAKTVSLSNVSNDIVTLRDGTPAFGVQILTETGRALSSILPSFEDKVGVEYARKLQAALPAGDVFLLIPDAAGQLTRASVP